MQNPSLELYQNRNQIIQDAYDILIANLYLNSNGNPPKTICIIGCEPNVGKTTVSINLAIALALSNWKVVFIDCDTRKKADKKRLAVESSSGISDYLAEEAEYEDILTETNHSNLTVIPYGNKWNKNPIGLLYSQRFNDLSAKLSKDYDFIVFDTPPWDSNADASVIASKCDRTFVIAEINKTCKADLQKTLSQLKTINANVIGVILNKVNKSEYKNYLGSYNYFKEKKRRKNIIKSKK